MIRSESGIHVTLAPGLFYWALLDASPLPTASRGRRIVQLGYLFERFIPVPIERVQAVYLPVAGQSGLRIACAMERDRLASIVGLSSEADREPSSCPPLTLGPATLPPILDTDIAAGVDVAAINLLVADFEPVSVRRLRGRILALSMVLFLVIGVAIVVGIERRTRACRTDVVAIDDTRQALYVDVLGPPDISSALSPEQRLLIELRLLRQTRHDVPSGIIVTDVCDDLGTLLSVWPHDRPIETESVTITPDTMILRCSVPKAEAVQRLADALGPIPGWRLEPPQITAFDGTVRSTLQLRREEGS